MKSVELYEHIEKVAIDETTPFDMLVEAEEGGEETPAPSSSGWKPDINDRALVGVGNFAADNPQKWKTFYKKLQHPHATNKELARMLGISVRTVINHCNDFMIHAESVRLTAKELNDAK